MLQIAAEIDEVWRADLHRLSFQPVFAENRIGWRVGRLGPRLAEIQGGAETDEWPQPRPIERLPVALHLAIRPQRVSAVIPHAVMDQRPARVAALVRQRRRL